MREILKRLRKDERGLTLVELLAVVVILGIVGGIAFVSIGNVIENSKKDAHIANAMQLVSAAKVEEISSGFPQGGYTTGTPAGTEEKLETIEGLTNPWNSDDESYVGKVLKDNDVYKVTIVGGSEDCKITLVPESELAKGRKVACGWTQTTN